MGKDALNEFWNYKPTFVSVDTETTGVGFYDYPFSASIAWLVEDWIQSFFFDLKDENDCADLVIILSSASNLVFHNAKFDLQKFKLAGIYDWRMRENSRTVEDTSIIAHLVNEHQSKKLKDLAVNVLGLEPLEEKALNDKLRELKIKKSEGFHNLPIEILKPYALKDAEYTIQSFNALYPLLSEGVREIYDLEKHLLFAFLDMEERGMKLDTSYLDTKIDEYRTLYFNSVIELRRLTNNDEFNPNSSQQLVSALGDQGIIVSSAGAEVLDSLKASPLVAEVLKFRNTHKMLNTYLENLKEMQHEGIIHPNFHSSRARTGRISSSTG